MKRFAVIMAMLLALTLFSGLDLSASPVHGPPTMVAATVAQFEAQPFVKVALGSETYAITTIALRGPLCSDFVSESPAFASSPTTYMDLAGANFAIIAYPRDQCSSFLDTHAFGNYMRD